MSALSEDSPEAQSTAMKNLGNTALLACHYTEACEHYSAAIDVFPTAVLYSNRAQCFIKMEQYGVAILDAALAIEMDPAYIKAYYRRGSANFALGKNKEAMKDFKHVVKLRPKDPDARNKLACAKKAVTEAAFAEAIYSELTAPLSDTIDVGGMSIPNTYDGPHPSTDGVLTDMAAEEAMFQPGMLPIEFVMDCIAHFKAEKLIAKRYVTRLLICCKRYFEIMPTLTELTVPEEGPNGGEGQITVCGDTHGQYYDVLHIFETNGNPSATNPYLFNGDFVDRGSFGLEVIVTYLLFKMSCLESIYLTRGNHETKNMNKIYGFEGEVKHKYDVNVFNLFLEVFQQLPLASTIDNKVFITHGGLSCENDVSMDDIRKIKRGCEPPESGIFSDLLWSDPQPFPGKSPSKRGVGYSFGPDITEKFLEYNNMELVVRSHEVKDEGYLVEHGGKCITIFSAPNYCDSMMNKGAFITFKKDCVPRFTQFGHSPHPEIRPMAYAAGGGAMGL
jgi:serine/threonine-protein phosphatase 5